MLCNKPIHLESVNFIVSELHLDENKLTELKSEALTKDWRNGCMDVEMATMVTAIICIVFKTTLSLSGNNGLH